MFSNEPHQHSQLYMQYMHSAEWHALRAQMIQHAVYRCQVCNDHHPHLTVHHRTYERLGHEAPEDLLVLCPNCHKLYEDHKRLPHLPPLASPPTVASQTERELPPSVSEAPQWLPSSWVLFILSTLLWGAIAWYAFQGAC